MKCWALYKIHHCLGKRSVAVFQSFQQCTSTLLGLFRFAPLFSVRIERISGTKSP